MSYMSRSGRLVVTIAITLLVSTGPWAQAGGTAQAGQAKEQSEQPGAAEKSSPQLRVQVTVARFTEGKKTTSLPFALWVTADGNPTMLNAGQRVPFPAKEWEYQNIGTSINCSARPAPDGRFTLNLHIRDSYPAPTEAGGRPATLKSIEASNRLHLRDGQTAEFVASTDLVTGEVTRIEVTATVLK